VKLIASNDVFQSQPVRASTDPLAGTNFTGGVIIILRQMLVEILLGIRQIFMRYGSEHGTDFNCFSKRFVHGVNNLSFRFDRQIKILPEGKPAKVSQRRKMPFEIPVRRGRWKPPEKETGFVIVARQKQFWHRPDFYGCQPWTRNASVLPIAPPALLLHGFDSFVSCPLTSLTENSTSVV
jgi:hypothetical protein